MTIRQVPGRADVFVGQRIDPALALDDLDHDARGVLADGLFQRADIVAMHETGAGQHRLEIAAILLLTGNGKCAKGPAVEGIEQRHRLILVGADLLAVRADDLERAFHGLGSRIAEEHAVEAGGLGDAFRQRTLVLVIVKIGRMQHPAGLLPDHFHQTRMSVPQGIYAYPRNEVQVPFAGSIVDVASLAAMQHQRVPRIVLEQVTGFQIDYGCGGRGDGGFHDLFIIPGAEGHYKETRDIIKNAPDNVRGTGARGRRSHRPHPAQTAGDRV